MKLSGDFNRFPLPSNSQPEHGETHTSINSRAFSGFFSSGKEKSSSNPQTVDLNSKQSANSDVPPGHEREKLGSSGLSQFQTEEKLPRRDHSEKKGPVALLSDSSDEPKSEVTSDQKNTEEKSGFVRWMPALDAGTNMGPSDSSKKEPLKDKETTDEEAVSNTNISTTSVPTSTPTEDTTTSTKSVENPPAQSEEEKQAPPVTKSDSKGRSDEMTSAEVKGDPAPTEEVNEKPVETSADDQSKGSSDTEGDVSKKRARNNADKSSERSPKRARTSSQNTDE